MGTSTVAYVEIKEPDVLYIFTGVKYVLEEMGASNVKFIDLKGFYRVSFSYNGEVTQLFMGFHYDYDYTDTLVKKVTFNLHYSESSMKIMKSICTWMNLSGIGDVYYHANDSEDDFIKFNGGL